MVFQFRMLSDENDHFVRDYEVMYDMNLLDFHRFILRSLGYESCMASFFTADDRWERGREFTVEDMGGGDSETAPLAMERVTLGQLIHNNRDRLIYLFDLFGDPGVLPRTCRGEKTAGRSGLPSRCIRARSGTGPIRPLRQPRRRVDFRRGDERFRRLQRRGWRRRRVTGSWWLWWALRHRARPT